MRHQFAIGMTGSLLGLAACLVLSIAAIGAASGVQWAVDLCAHAQFLYAVLAGQFVALCAMGIAISGGIRK